jgi:hypothetical protein
VRYETPDFIWSANGERRDPGLVREVNVHVLADILLLVDLLKPARMVLEKQPRRVHAIPAGGPAGTRLHYVPPECRTPIAQLLVGCCTAALRP